MVRPGGPESPSTGIDGRQEIKGQERSWKGSVQQEGMGSEANGW